MLQHRAKLQVFCSSNLFGLWTSKYIAFILCYSLKRITTTTTKHYCITFVGCGVFCQILAYETLGKPSPSYLFYYRRVTTALLVSFLVYGMSAFTIRRTQFYGYYVFIPELTETLQVLYCMHTVHEGDDLPLTHDRLLSRQ